MTPTTTGEPWWLRVRRRLATATRTQAALWAGLERIAPDPDPYLHWEPTTAGWQLHGTFAPPCDVPPAG